MTERELLAQLYNFIISKQIVMGDEGSIMDMVVRYKSPPFTIAYPAALRMTLADTHVLNDLLQEVQTLMASTEVTPLRTPIVDLEAQANGE